MSTTPNKNEQNDRKLAVIVTTAFFSIVFVLFLIFGFITPLPLPEEEGIEVVLGDTDIGMDIPMPSSRTNNVVNPSPESSSKPVSESNEKVETQTTEEAPVIKEQEKTDNTRTEQVQETNNDNQSQETNKQENTENKEPERKSDKRFEMTNDFSKGNDQNKGNKGSKKGTRTTGSYGDGGGIGWNLKMGGRGLLKDPPPIQAQYNRKEIVVLEITVNRQGKVLNVKPTIKFGATRSDPSHPLVKSAIQAGYKLEIEQDMDAFEEQVGYFTFVFNPK